MPQISRYSDFIEGIQGARSVWLDHSTISIVNGNSHATHIHYPVAIDKLKAVLDAICNYRKIQQDTLAKATPGTILWLLECKEFKVFVDTDGTLKFLWGSGMRTLVLDSTVQVLTNFVSSRCWKDRHGVWIP